MINLFFLTVESIPLLQPLVNTEMHKYLIFSTFVHKFALNYRAIVYYANFMHKTHVYEYICIKICCGD